MQCMEECGIAPDTHTLNAVVTALRAGAQPDLILSFVQHMKKVGGSVGRLSCHCKDELPAAPFDQNQPGASCACTILLPSDAPSH